MRISSLYQMCFVFKRIIMISLKNYSYLTYKHTQKHQKLMQSMINFLNENPHKIIDAQLSHTHACVFNIHSTACVTSLPDSCVSTRQKRTILQYTGGENFTFSRSSSVAVQRGYCKVYCRVIFFLHSFEWVVLVRVATAIVMICEDGYVLHSWRKCGIFDILFFHEVVAERDEWQNWYECWNCDVLQIFNLFTSFKTKHNFII